MNFDESSWILMVFTVFIAFIVFFCLSECRKKIEEISGEKGKLRKSGRRRRTTILRKFGRRRRLLKHTKRTLSMLECLGEVV